MDINFGLEEIGAKPGGEYRFNLHCHDNSWFGSSKDSYENFSVRPLAGSFQAKLDSNDHLIVTGTVGNGANRATVYLVENGKETLFWEGDGLTSDFSFDKNMPRGQHELKVYVHYGSHSQSIGSRTVYSDAVVTLEPLPDYTNNSEIQVHGRAESFNDKFFFGNFEWGNEFGENNVGEPFIVFAGNAFSTVDEKKSITLKKDGKYDIHFWVNGSNILTKFRSSARSIRLDRKPPEISIGTTTTQGKKVEYRVLATDSDLEGGPGSGIATVKAQATDKNGTKSSWISSTPSGTQDEYSVLISSDSLAPGPIKVEIQATDGAGNSASITRSYTTYDAPTVFMTIPSSPTQDAAVEVSGKAHAEAGLKTIKLGWGKEGESKALGSADLPFKAGNDAEVKHKIDSLPGDGVYWFKIAAEAKDGQETVSAPKTVMVDTTPPVITILSPKPSSTHEKELDFKFRVEDAGAGVHDIDIRVGNDKSPTMAIAVDQSGEYSLKLPLDAVTGGEFTVTVRASDKAGNAHSEQPGYIKRVQAVDALAVSLHMLSSGGGTALDPFYADQQGLLRVSVTPKIALKGLNIAYTLPAGLSQNGTPVLKTASSALPQNMQAQLKNWQGRDNLIAGVDLAQGQTLEVDIPVTIDRGATVPNPKLGGAEQTTYFDVTGSNFTDAARAQTQWKTQWKQDPANVQQPISEKFDLSSPPDIQIFDARSGGYDTADPTKWNRNTLHCTSGNAACETDAGATAVKLPFTDSTSGQTVTLKLIGQRHLTPSNGGAIRNTPLQSEDNTGADAEARFSLRLPKEELARLPVDGMWQADLNLVLQDHNGTALANFRSAIKLDVGDTTGMALTPPQIELLPGSHRDHDDSGGYSAGDELTYRISYTAARDLTEIQLDYALPPGLEKAGPTPTFAENSDMKPDGELSADWHQALLKQGVQMKKGNTLIIDVPLRIQSDSEVHIVSQVAASAKGYASMLSTKTILQVQRRFSVARALTLTLDMSAPPVSGQSDPTLAGAAVAQQAPFVYRIVLTAQKQSVEEASLRYRLPGGLYLAGSPSLVVDATKKVKLNANWDGDTNDELLDAKTILAPSQTITIEIPVAVKELVDDGVAVQSTVNASAGNLIDALSAKHTVKVRERQRSGGDQVMVVKSSDANASVQPGANIMYRIRVSNQTSKIARNLLIRDRAPDHTTLLSSSCGELSSETCKTYLLNDSDIVEAQMTHDALCTTPGRKSAPEGHHVIWCLNGDLEPLDEYVVDYTIQVNGTAPL